ncbi:phosphoribosylanthranilate isomerase [Sporomusa sp.]|uniref:phosphoribosylanthranilate isomerase n=1 Tax=Sporomusa sp. TaxID=2078658 RepID=UPI002BF5FF4E|nr:phosphoribosylanthranilate isomerase [Sporomusa sp.]HWR43795.1 phosphoribosylanthranilate isomerase [Sporomusa sp.]
MAIIIKICGITTIEAALAAREFGADLIGFVFADSRRHVTVEKAQEIACQISGIGKVGVFVNAPLTKVQSIARECQLDYVQLHGDESPEYCSLIGYPVIKAFRFRPGFSVEAFNGYQQGWTLLDSFSAGQQGGTGITFDWQEAQALVWQTPRPFMVAGGLTPDNVAEAIQILKPDGVDVSGGVETNGVKDSKKIERFIAAVRGAEVADVK